MGKADNKQLEEDIKQINYMLENIDDGLDFFKKHEEVIELYLKRKHALKTALNYIENSIPKQLIEEKIEEIKSNKNHKYTAGTVVAIMNELEELLEGK